MFSRRSAVLLLLALLAPCFWGCLDKYDYYTTSRNLDRVTVDDFAWEFGDSLGLADTAKASLEKFLNPMSIKLEMYQVDSAGENSVGEPLYVDIFDCTDYGCKNGTRAVVHNAGYSYSRLLLPGDFEVSVPEGEFYIREHGYDCDVTKDYFFHFSADVEGLRIEMDVQRGEETCFERDAKCYGFC